jgi:hypothetical protein
VFAFYFIAENMRHSIVSNIQAKANKGRSKGGDAAIGKITQSNTYTSRCKLSKFPGKQGGYQDQRDLNTDK